MERELLCNQSVPITNELDNIVKDKEIAIDKIINEYLNNNSSLRKIELLKSKESVTDIAKRELDVNAKEIFEVGYDIYYHNKDITKEQLTDNLLQFIATNGKTKTIKKIAKELVKERKHR